MAFLTELWLPIVLSAVFVFIVSSIIHMALPIHKNDHKQLPNEDSVLAALRSAGVQPGSYRFPYVGCSPKEMKTPEAQEKMRLGPIGLVNISPPGGWNMGLALTMWFVFSLLVSAVTAYVAWHALGPGAPYLEVFRIAGAAAVLGYALHNMQESIWKGEPWGTSAKFIFDGVVYALVTAGTFGWLWPTGVVPAV